jgi:alcohol dehydrogenase class IV
MEFNVEGQEEKFRKIARAMGLKKKTGKAVVKHIRSLNKKIGMPSSLSKIGVTVEHLETLADLAFADFCHPNNPKPVLRQQFRELYEKAL